MKKSLTAVCGWAFLVVLALSIGSIRASYASLSDLGSQDVVSSEESEGAEIEDLGLALAAPHRMELAPQVNPDFFDILFSAPTSSAEQARGFYAKGSLAHASKFALEGEGFVKILRPRNRGFATEGYINMIEAIAATVHSQFPDGERLQIADIAAQYGGPISGHSSHENGLDGDLVYYRNNHAEQDPEYAGGLKELFVINGKISSNFDDKRNWMIINHLYQTGRLVRIFMDPVIKAELCDYAKKIGDFNSDGVEVLRHLRPLVDHKDHMHVRITCPEGDKACVSQSEVPPGSGCPDSFK